MFVWLGMTLMKLIIVLVLLLALQGSASASEDLIEAASVVGDSSNFCVSRREGPLADPTWRAATLRTEGVVAREPSDQPVDPGVP